MKLSVGLATAGLLLVATAACGGGDSDTKSDDKSDKPAASAPAASGSDDYCGALAATAEEHFSGAEDVLVDPEAAYGALQQIGSKAPEEVKADWQVMGESVQGLLGALDELNISFDDLDAIFMGETPEGSDLDSEAAMTVLEPAFAAASSPEVSAAQDRIQTHALSACDVDLSLGVAPEDN